MTDLDDLDDVDSAHEGDEIDETSAEAPADVVPAPSSGRSAGFILAVALALVFGALAVVFAVLFFTDDSSSSDADRREVARIAGTFSEEFLTYDYTDLDAHRDAVAPFLTASYADVYNQTLDDVVAPILETTEARQTGSVTDVFVSEIDEGTARVVVRASGELDATSGRRQVSEIYMLLDLISVDGEWKVDEVTSLNFNAEGPAVPGAPSSSTTTSAG